MQESNDLESQHILALLEKQVKKIISENNVKDPYFTIRQDFDIDQFVWDISVYIYKSSGYHIELMKTNQLILAHQSSASALYKQEQEKIRLENIRIQVEQEKIRLENIRIEKENIPLEIKNLEEKEEKLKLSGKYPFERQILLQISSLQEREIFLLKEQEKDIFYQVEQAQRAYDLNRAAELKYGKLEVLQEEITKKEIKLTEIQVEIQTKIKLEQEQIQKKELEEKEQRRIKQEEQDKIILDQILPLIKKFPIMENSILKAKVYLCLTKIIEEDFETDADNLTWDTNFEKDLKHESYEEHLARVNDSGSWSSGSGGFGFGFSEFDVACLEFIESIQKLLNIEFTDEEESKCLIDIGSLVDFIISRFQYNPKALEAYITKYLLDNS
jgi:hypothetical protein